MSTDFTCERLNARIHTDESGTYIMIEVDGSWIAIKKNGTSRVLGDNMTETDAMKIVDFHVRQSNERLKEDCEHCCKSCTCKHD